MKNFFKRLTAMLLVAIMVAPQFQLPSFAWGQSWSKTGENLVFWRADSSTSYTSKDSGGTISAKDPVTQSAFGNVTVNFDNEKTSYDTFGDYVQEGRSADAPDTHAVMNDKWVAYTSSTSQTDPPIADFDNDGNREINLRELNGSIHTYDTLKGAYNFSFEMAIDAAPTSEMGSNALWAFFRGDEGDFQTTENNYSTVYDRINDDGSLGGSGLAFFVSGTNEITLVIKTALEGRESKITHESIRFVTQTTLTDGKPHKYTVMDTGIDDNPNGEGNYIYLMVDDEPVCYIRATGFKKYSTTPTTRMSYVTTDVNKDANGNDIQIYNATKVNYHFNSLQPDTSYYYHNLLVYSPTGIIVHESFNALCRNYSRLALGGCRVTANTYIDDIAVTAYNRDAFEEAAQAQIDTSKGIYLPITIRDFAADSILFEWLNNTMDNGEWEKLVENVGPTAVVSTHSSSLIGHRWHHTDATVRSYFSSYFDLHPTSATQADENYRIDYTVAYDEASYVGDNPDGSITVESLSTGNGDAQISAKFTTAFSPKGYTYFTYAFKPTDGGTFVSGETVQFFFFRFGDTHINARLDLATMTVTIDGLNDTKVNGTVKKSNEPGYEDYYIVYVPILTNVFASSDTISSFRVDFTDKLNRSYDILYFAFMDDIFASGRTELGDNLDTGNVQYSSDVEKNNTAYSLYPYYRFTNTFGGSKTAKLNTELKNTAPTTDAPGKDTFASGNVEVYGVDKTYTAKIEGYVYLRYRVPDGVTPASKFRLRDTNDQTNDRYIIAERDYIADGNWHDIIIPVSIQTNGTDIVDIYFECFSSGTSSGAVVDISAFRYLNAVEAEYATGYNSDNWPGNIDYINRKNASFTAAANRGGHIQIDGSSASNAVYFSPESYTANGKLFLYENTALTDTTLQFSLPDVTIDTDTAKFLQLRYRTNITTPVTLTFTLSNGKVYTYDYDLKADGTWNTRVLELKMPAGLTVSKIEATYDSADGLWLEIGDLNFYETRNAAWYYSNDPTYDFSHADNDHCSSYAGFGFEGRSRIWRDITGDGVYDEIKLYYYPITTKNDGYNIGETNGTGFDQSISGTFISAATGDNGEVMSHAKAYQGMLEDKLVDGKPRYTYRAVSYIAKHLEIILPIELDDEYGYKNYGSLLGEESMYIAEKVGVDYPIEMREALLMCIEGELSTEWSVVESTETYKSETAYNYKWNTTESEYKKYDGYATFAELKANAGTNDCFDLAYFLLHNLFTDEYGTEVYEYNALKLIQGYDEDGVMEEPSYTFDTNRDDTRYEPTGTGDGFTGLIYNTQAATAAGTFKDGYMFSDNKYDFDPMGTQRDMQLGEGLEGADSLGFGNSTYGTMSAMDKDKNDRFYRDFHYTMQGSANFVYNVDRDQYFDFIGDDDVYLFINNTLVLDVGGAHLPSRGVIYLNDLVEKGTLNLVDGNEYTFEFFYMERHFGDANISINTNIELSVPEIDVVKDGYQEDSKGTLNKLQYGDNIIEGKPVIYEFSLTNTTSEQFDHKLTDIKFVDNDLGVTISQDVVDWGNKGAELADGAFVELTDANGNSLRKILCSTDVDIKDAFKNIELERGQTLTIRGVSYTLSPGTETFHNTVTGAATYYKAYNDDGTPVDESVATLTDTDDFLVNVSEMHVYVQKDVERQFIFREIFDNSTRIGGSTYGELKNQAYFKNSAYIQLCDGYKKPITNIDEIHFTNNSSQLLTFETNISNNAYLTTDATGLSTFMFTVNYNEPQPDGNEIARSYGPYYVAVYSYAFEDKNYVLDYGLPVVIEDELNASTSADYNKIDPYIDQKEPTETSAQSLDEGYDVFKLADNPEATVTQFIKYSNYSTLKYGSLNIDDATQATKPKENLTYTPNKFIEGRDSFNVTVGVYEKEIDDDNLFKDNVYHITNGVQMTKTVSFVPASVMYYEESIGSISLRDTENKMTFGSASLNQPNTQSANQSYNYGYDPEAYKDDPDLSTGIANATFSWYGKAAISCGPVISTNGGTGQYTYNFSNGTYAHLNTNPAVGTYDMKTACVKFTFTGTGFDVISTTDLAAAMIDVRIYDHETGALTYRLPVNCTYTNGTLSQVPVFSKKDLTWGTYNVEIYASKPYNTYLSTDFYLDGIRIYNPAEDDIVDNEYLDDEKDVEFNSIRDMILTAGTVAVSQISLNGTGDKLITTTGVNNSVVEHIHDANGSWGSSNDVLGDSYHDDTNFKDYAYDAVGPKNECYLSYGTGLVMSITKTADISTLQVEARLIDQGTDKAKFKYVIYNGTTRVDGVVTSTVNSHTAMYFDIDLSLCEVGKTYNIAFGPSEDGNRVPVCFTNVKSKGIAFANIGTLGTDGKYNITGGTYNSIFLGLNSITGIWNVDDVTSDSIVIHKASTATNTAAGTISFKVQTSHNVKRVEIWEGNTKIAESTTANTFGSIKLFAVKVTGLDLTKNHNFTVKAFDSETGGTAAAENKTVSYTASGAVTVVDGTLLYYEDFESSTYTDKTNDNLMGALGWPGADSYADVNNPAYGIYKDTTTGNKALSITGYNTTASRTLLSILTPEQMKPYYGTGKIITLQYDLMYTDNNSDPSKFFSISPAFNSVDNKYIFSIIRYSGKANNATVTDNYSGGSSITASSTNLKNKQISVRNVLDWSANTNTLYVKGHDNTGNWKILSTIDLSASPETFAGGITLITGGKQNGYIDNIMVWTGNAGTNAEPTDKTDPVLQPDTSKGETTVPNGTLLYYQNFESDKYTGTDNSLLQTLGWTNKSGTTDNYSTYSIYTDSATGNKALNITKAKTEDSTLNRAFVEILSSDAMESYYGSNKAVTVQYDFVYTEGNSGNFFTVSPAYNSTNNKNIFVVIRNTGEDGINAAEKGNNGGLYQFDSKISAKDKLNVSDMNNQSFSVRHILDWQSRKSIIYIRSNGSADNSWKLYSSATIDPEINPEDMGGGIALVSGNFQSGYVDNIMVWTGNAGTGDEPTDKRNQILQPEFDIGSEPVG